jgi:methionine-rich copper-binding protein CopC
MFRRYAIACLTLGGLLLAQDEAWAQNVRVMESVPAPNARVAGGLEAFSVRFDKPIDHLHSLLIIKQKGKVIETLHPRLKTEPNVLFAQLPALPPGDYVLQWQVKTLTGAEIAEGEIPFAIGPGN